MKTFILCASILSWALLSSLKSRFEIKIHSSKKLFNSKKENGSASVGNYQTQLFHSLEKQPIEAETFWHVTCAVYRHKKSHFPNRIFWIMQVQEQLWKLKNKLRNFGRFTKVTDLKVEFLQSFILYMNMLKSCVKICSLRSGQVETAELGAFQDI